MNVQSLQLLLLIAVGIVALSIGLLVAVIFFFLNLHMTLARCGRRNRTMEPAMVWLILVPLFNYYWWFHIVIQVSRSLKNEFSDREKDDGSDYGRALGIWWGVIYVTGVVLGMAVQWTVTFAQFGQGQFAPQDPLASLRPVIFTYLVQSPFLLVSLVLWILYWTRISGYRKRLEVDGEPRDRDDDRWRRFDDDDDRDFGQDPIRPARPDDRIR
jgi:hypothetical protein